MDATIVDQFNNSDAFGQLLDAATSVSEQHTEMPGADIAAMYIALANFVGAVYPDHLDYIDRVLQSCHEVLHVYPAQFCRQYCKTHSGFCQGFSFYGVQNFICCAQLGAGVPRGHPFGQDREADRCTSDAAAHLL